MSKTHIIEAGIVVNTILATVAEAQVTFTQSICLDADLHGGGIGWTWDGVTLTAPVVEPSPIEVPKSVTMRQARLALLGAGLLESVQAAIASMPGPEGEAARIEWEFAADVRRDWPLLEQLAPVLGLSASEVDALFVAAEAL